MELVQLIRWGGLFRGFFIPQMIHQRLLMFLSEGRLRLANNVSVLGHFYAFARLSGLCERGGRKRSRTHSPLSPQHRPFPSLMNPPAPEL